MCVTLVVKVPLVHHVTMVVKWLMYCDCVCDIGS